MAYDFNKLNKIDITDKEARKKFLESDVCKEMLSRKATITAEEFTRLSAEVSKEMGDGICEISDDPKIASVVVLLMSSLTAKIASEIFNPDGDYIVKESEA